MTSSISMLLLLAIGAALICTIAGAPVDKTDPRTRVQDSKKVNTGLSGKSKASVEGAGNKASQLACKIGEACKAGAQALKNKVTGANGKPVDGNPKSGAQLASEGKGNFGSLQRPADKKSVDSLKRNPVITPAGSPVNQGPLRVTNAGSASSSSSGSRPSTAGATNGGSRPPSPVSSAGATAGGSSRRSSTSSISSTAGNAGGSKPGKGGPPRAPTGGLFGFPA